MNTVATPKHSQLAYIDETIACVKVGNAFVQKREFSGRGVACAVGAAKDLRRVILANIDQRETTTFGSGSVPLHNSVCSLFAALQLALPSCHMDASCHSVPN